MVCNGICKKYWAKKPYDNNRYLIGQKRCQICGIFINWNGLSCPCCNFKLQLKPRHSKNKATLLQKLS